VSVSGVAEKHDFCGIQRKIPQISDFAKNWDSNPPSHWDTAADIAKMFANFFAKIGFRVKKHDFRENPIGFFRNSPDSIPKIGFCEKLFSRFLQFFRYSAIFGK
jgi:hypothetical protein